MNETLTIPLADRLVSVAEMQAIERAADAGGHSFAAMMEAAGKAVATAVLARTGAAPVLVLAGPGNNGGDGLVCAHYLHEAGAVVRVYLWQRGTEAAYDYAGRLAKLTRLGVPVANAADDGNRTLLTQWVEGAVVVDALLGTGANRPIEGQLAAILQGVQAAQQRGACRVVAVDCASGLNCDTGAVSAHTLAPELTVTFAHAKLGHYRFPGADFVGELVVADIGVPQQLAGDARVFLLTEAVIHQWLPARPRASHKGTFGKVLLAVGSEHFAGAAYLSCAAAGRVGAGLVTGAVLRSIWPIVAGRLAEPTWLPLAVRSDGEQGGVLDSAAAGTVAAVLGGYDALVLGCGLGNNAATCTFVDQVLRQPAAATLIDADGLNCLAQLADWPTRLPARCVLTPHPAEMGRLCALSPAAVTARRWELAREKAAAWGCVVLVKGPYTVVAHPDGWLGVLPVATPALATAGTGDVLAGVIGGLLAQGLDPFAAACVGAWVHGEAGLRTAQAIGGAGAIASDLLVHLPEVIGAVQRHAAIYPITLHEEPDLDAADVVAM